MKSRLSLIFTALAVLLGAMVWVVQDRPVTRGFPEAPEPVLAIAAAPAAGPPVVAATTTAPAAPDAQVKDPPTVRIGSSGDVQYVARPGDTVSQLAAALLGSGSKDSRDAVIAANPSLRSNPDRVLIGQMYSGGATAAQPSDSSGTDGRPAGADASALQRNDAPDRKATGEDRAGGTANSRASNHGPAPAGGPRLKYTAEEGDTVSGLASDLLGGDTKANQEGITAGNASLREDPDQLVAGRSYTIVARNGLAAAAPTTRPIVAPTTQPDADEAIRIGAGRVLRYTAKPGDTVSKLAVALLGSDTPANRELILRSNFNLKQDPNHLVAGQTYWINAPTAD